MAFLVTVWNAPMASYSGEMMRFVLSLRRRLISFFSSSVMSRRMTPPGCWAWSMGTFLELPHFLLNDNVIAAAFLNKSVFTTRMVVFCMLVLVLFLVMPGLR